MARYAKTNGMDSDAFVVGVNTQELARLGRKYGFTFDKAKLLAEKKNGDPIFAVRDEKGRQTVYVLNEIYIQEVVKKYSCHPKIKTGRELLISNFPQPPMGDY